MNTVHRKFRNSLIVFRSIKYEEIFFFDFITTLLMYICKILKLTRRTHISYIGYLLILAFFSVFFFNPDPFQLIN